MHDGRACIIECNTIEKIHRICKRSTGSHNIQYTINYVDLRQKQDIITHDKRMQGIQMHNTTLQIQQALPQIQAANIQLQLWHHCVQSDDDDEIDVGQTIIL